MKVAVLAALNIADEYFRAGDDVDDRQAGFAHRAREIERMLDLALASGRERLASRLPISGWSILPTNCLLSAIT